MVRHLVAALALACGACGRLGFGEVGGDALAVDAVDLSGIIDVDPAWAPPAGQPIRVTLAPTAPSDAITIDGVACGAPMRTGDVVTCTAPPRVGGEVAIAAGGAAWARPFRYLDPGIVLAGGLAEDNSSGVAFDAWGNVFVSGGTTGDLDGANAGSFDAFVAKFDGAGALVWVRQLGSPAYDYARDVAVSPAGEVTLVGYTAGQLGATPNAGGNDVFVARWTTDGALRWVAQTGSSGDDQAWDLAVDGSGATTIAVRSNADFAGPNTGEFDAAIARYADDGALAWARQFGTAVRDIGHSVAVTDDGVAFLVGYTLGVVEPGATNAGALDLFVARYEADGTQAWIRQRGGPGDQQANDVTISDDGDVWIVGSTQGAIDGEPYSAGNGSDVYAMRFGADGTWKWTRTRGGPGDQITFGIGVAPNGGDVFLGCSTTGAFDGQVWAGDSDGCAISWDRTGAHRWTRTFGTPEYEAVSSLALQADAFDGLAFLSVIGSASATDRNFGFARVMFDGTWH